VFWVLVILAVLLLALGGAVVRFVQAVGSRAARPPQASA
jgi:hypothetical protein